VLALTAHGIFSFRVSNLVADLDAGAEETLNLILEFQNDAPHGEGVPYRAGSVESQKSLAH
jgi:hypothetical protein